METNLISGLSFVVPMYNEAGNIKEMIRVLSAAGRAFTADYEIIIVDDASTDDSAAIVKELAQKDKSLKLISLPLNTRFTGALKEGLKIACKEIVIYTDADLSIDADDIKKALPLMAEVDVLNTYSERRKGETRGRMIMSWVYNSLVNSIFRLRLRDINSSFKIFKQKVLQDLTLSSTSPFIDAEIFLKAKARGYRLGQIPIVFKDRLTGKSTMARPSVILAVFLDIIKFRFLAGGLY